MICLRARSPRRPFQAQLIGNRLLDDGTLEEARVVARVQHGRIGERELAKVLFGDEALLNLSNASGMTSAKSGTSKCVIDDVCTYEGADN